MTPTHKSKMSGDPIKVTAWQFAKDKPIPVWVAREFHGVGSQRTAIADGGQLVELNESDWAVSIRDIIVIVLTNEEFTKLFEPL